MIISAEFRMYRDDEHQEDTAFMMVADGGNFFCHQSCHHHKLYRTIVTKIDIASAKIPPPIHRKQLHKIVLISNAIF